MAEQSLKDKTAKGVAWSGIDNVIQFVVSFVVNIVLARLLSPDDYGLIGIIVIFTTICNALIDGGFGDALVRKKTPTDDDYNTAFIVNIFISLILYAIVYVSSPFIAHFFGRVELITLTRVSSLGIIVGALSLVQLKRMTKRIDFKSQTKVTIIASVISGAIGIAMALFGCGVWSLVAQGLSLQILRTVFLWFYNHWIPKLVFSNTSFKELFDFGWKMWITGLLNAIWKEISQVVVGKFYSPATLGQFTRAKQFSSLFSNNLTSVIQRVTFPVLSNIQDEKERMMNAYRRIIKVTMFMTATCMFFLGAVSEPLLYCLIGPKWHDAAVYLPLICISGSLYPLHAINLNMLMIQGRSDLFLYLEIIKKFIYAVPLCLGIFVGIIPMLLASIIAGIIAYFLNSYYSGKMIGYSTWMQIKDVIPSYGLATFIALSVWFLKFLPLSNWIILPLQMSLGVVVFFIVCKIKKMEEYEEIKNLIAPFIKKIK